MLIIWAPTVSNHSKSGSVIVRVPAPSANGDFVRTSWSVSAAVIKGVSSVVDGVRMEIKRGTTGVMRLKFVRSVIWMKKTD